MNDSSFDSKFGAAVGHLRSGRPCEGSDGFEREVWAEIAVRDGRMSNRILRWLGNALAPRSPLAAAVTTLAAILCGLLFALDRADAYEARESSALERRYVASIHPVLRFETLRTNREP